VNNVQIKKNRLRRIAQGDVFRDVECIEYITETRGVIEVSKIVFPLVVVLTQDCDLEQDARYKIPTMKRPSSDDKRLLSVLVVPLYNAAHVFQGTHLSDLDLAMVQIRENKSDGNYLKNNERPRYHYLEFADDVQIVAQIADFKHYFSLNSRYLEAIRAKNFVCRISELFREDLSQRFAAYLARIGLPESAEKSLPQKRPSSAAK